jgi:hypothetical protein
LAQVRGEGHDQSHLQGAAHGLARAVNEDRRDGHRDDELDEREDRAPERVGTHDPQLRLRVVALEGGQVVLLLPEGPYDGTAGETFCHVRRHLCERVTGLPPRGSRRALKRGRHDDDEREHERRDQRHSPVEREQDNDRSDDQEQVRDELV